MTAVRDMVEEMVDSVFDGDGDIQIGNLTFSRSAIVRELDPVAYRECVNNMADSMIEDLRYDLDRLDPEVDAEEIADIQERIEMLENL